MAPSHPFVRTLAALPIAADVKRHSIIAVKGRGDPATSHDGVVTYSSAHLEDADSEFVVRSGHSCQAHPLTIAEVRRIMLEHLDDVTRQKKELRVSAYTW